MSHRETRPGRRPLAATAVLMLLAGGGTAVTTQLTAATASAATVPLAATPPMGWNPWTYLRCSGTMNEKTVKANIDAMVTSGLKAAGYAYVNLDDCWAAQQRGADGRLQADPVRFPSGIKSLADYAHAKGLKFGVYSSAGTATCAGVGPGTKGFPGGQGHEAVDADTWYSWGVDYLKYDACNSTPPAANDPENKARYQAMGDALKAAGQRYGRQIVYSICDPVPSAPTWAPTMGNLWRTTGDIGRKYGSMTANFHENSKLSAYAKPGAWNDPDMLLTGNYHMSDNDPARPGLNPVEERSQFSLWAEMAAPLIISTDLPAQLQEKAAGVERGRTTFDVLLNKDVIAVDQDPLGKQGTVVSRVDLLPPLPNNRVRDRLDERFATVLTKPLADGSRAVTLTNEGDTDRAMSTNTTEIGLRGADNYTVKDLWTKQVTVYTGSYFHFTVPAHATVMITVTPTN
ncbi:glycoside hydrolase family 27 protein [Kitasatospora sp. NBC_00240]|uniref:glycoside hydrolase family 27 protein n=1 Tax=Kitasatospora sp. NBC_00240 TaxID=2903567 RepID=UPI002255B47F|nr:glycoside hydrolase family 27 protein [Kitasatospora sp. NBC_00240]MCX5214347.1 glycoside hydrolase family 27 protein [Kitasatospora sp. NBC_00240]